MYKSSTKHDHHHDHDHDHNHDHSREENSHAHSHSHSQPHSLSSSPPKHSPSPSLGPPRTRTHRYSPSVGRASLGNGYAFPPPGPIVDGGPTPALAYAAATVPLPHNTKKRKQEAFATDDHADPIALTLSSLTTPLLITTTLVLVSLAHSVPYEPSSAIGDALLQSPADPSTVRALLGHFSTAAAISSGTLFLTFFFGFIRQHLPNTADEGGGYARRKSLPVSMRVVFERVAGVWACYYATIELGGVRAASLVLACLAAGLDGVGFRGLGKRKAVLSAITVAAGWDFWRGMVEENGGLGTLVAYVVLVAGMVGLRSPWTPDAKPTLHFNNVSFVAACALGVVALLGWIFGLNTAAYLGTLHGRANAKLELLACIIGASGMVLDGGAKADAAYGAGVFAAVAGAWAVGLIDGYDVLSEAGLGGLALAAVSFDKSSASSSHSHGHSHSHSNGHAHDHSHGDHDGHKHHCTAPPSAATKFLLRKFEGMPLIHSILLEKDSRRISYFMCLNFVFMIVQTLYGFLTGSLGLISDSVHMFFDCLALGVGVCAAVMSKRPSSTRYPYGLGKMDTLAGFANGIFLMLISIEIVFEALERLKSPTEMARLGELFVVSTAGLAVNMVGIFAFDHAHMHGGGDHGHSHSHGAHAHGGDNMHGIFLHILADALGSVSVVISTLLIHYTSWPGFDPLASMLIAILIFASSVPLVTSAAKNLLLTVDAGTEYTLRETLAGISVLPGVMGYQATRFWESEKGALRGVVHVSAEGDTEIVRRRVEEWLKQNVEGVDVTVVVEKGGETCWCRKKD
ncbi:cation efflux protein [Wilcoxina mikolae CBS 423.85]|nr:cation efflux protein [Wilcoxina mikolae CBS 423.85]